MLVKFCKKRITLCKFPLKNIIQVEVYGTICIIGAVLLLLLAVEAVATLFGFFFVTVRIPLDLYRSHFVEENNGFLQRLCFKRFESTIIITVTI